MPTSFPPMWSSGEREGDDAYLKSYEAIYRSQPNLAAVVDKLTRRIATLPFDAYRGCRTMREMVVDRRAGVADREADAATSRVHLWRTSRSRC
jgi:hypothetical protein